MTLEEFLQLEVLVHRLVRPYSDSSEAVSLDSLRRTYKPSIYWRINVAGVLTPEYLAAVREAHGLTAHEIFMDWITHRKQAEVVDLMLESYEDLDPDTPHWKTRVDVWYAQFAGDDDWTEIFSLPATELSLIERGARVIKY